MADYELDFSDMLKLEKDVDVEAHEVAKKAYPVAKEFAERIRKDWRENARGTARQHGKHYPRSITAEQKHALDGPDWEIGPESAMPQGGMGAGFEYGGPHQPPHLDGARAAAGVEGPFEAAVVKIASEFFR